MSCLNRVANQSLARIGDEVAEAAEHIAQLDPALNGAYKRGSAGTAELKACLGDR